MYCCPYSEAFLETNRYTFGASRNPHVLVNKKKLKKIQNSDFSAVYIEDTVFSVVLKEGTEIVSFSSYIFYCLLFILFSYTAK